MKIFFLPLFYNRRGRCTSALRQKPVIITLEIKTNFERIYRESFFSYETLLFNDFFLSLRNTSLTPPTGVGDVRSSYRAHSIELIFEVQTAFDEQSGSVQNVVRTPSLVFFGDFSETGLHTNGL